MRPVLACCTAVHTEECDHLIGLASPRLERSGVVQTQDDGAGKQAVHNIRTSSGAFLERAQDPVVAGACARHCCAGVLCAQILLHARRCS